MIGTANNTWAYQAMTVVLILLPLAMVGATVWWLTRLAARGRGELATGERRGGRGRAVDG